MKRFLSLALVATALVVIPAGGAMAPTADVVVDEVASGYTVERLGEQWGSGCDDFGWIIDRVVYFLPSSSFDFGPNTSFDISFDLAAPITVNNPDPTVTQARVGADLPPFSLGTFDEADSFVTSGPSVSGSNVAEEGSSLGVWFSVDSSLEFLRVRQNLSALVGPGTPYVIDGLFNGAGTIPVDAPDSNEPLTPYFSVLSIAECEPGDNPPPLLSIADDDDADGVLNGDDLCPDTNLPDEPTVELRGSRFAAQAVDGAFDSGRNKFDGLYTLADTHGCSGTQIIEMEGLGRGHTRFGISKSALEAFIAGLNGG